VLIALKQSNTHNNVKISVLASIHLRKKMHV